MSEPSRLLESANGTMRAMLEASKRDGPSEHAEASVLAALGLGAAAGAALGAPAALAKGSLLARALGQVFTALASKAGIAIVVATVAGGAGYAHGRRVERTEAARAVLIAAPSLPAPLPLPRMLVPAPVLAPSSSPPPPIPQTPPAPPRAEASSRSTPQPELVVSPPPTATATEVAIGVQLESIRRARLLVADANGAAALAELDAYDARNPRGLFQEESMALRVRALRLRGDAAAADRVLEDLNARFPRSVHAAALEK